MLGKIALFELRYQLRRPITYISFVVFTGLAFGLMCIAALGPGGIILNAPVRIASVFGSLSILGMFLSVATLADVALRDAETGMDAIMRTKPVRTDLYFSAKFFGAFIVAALAFSGVVLGHIVACYMPWMPAGSIGRFRADAYATAMAVIALPNLLVTGAFFFTVASLTRSLLATYLSALGLFILYIATQILLSDSSYRAIAALSDPFGVRALWSDLAYWSNFELNNRLAPITGLLLWNRLAWIGISGALLLLSLTLLNRRDSGSRITGVTLVKAATSPIMYERPTIVPGGVSAWDQFMVRARHETGSILRSWTFFVLLVFAVLLPIAVLFGSAAVQTTPTLPVTYHVVQIVAGSLALCAILVPIAYGGELIWRDRKVRIAAIVDATPTPTGVFLLSKIIAVALVILLLLAVGMAVGVVFQLINGATDIDIGVYLVGLVLGVGLPAILYGVTAIFIQTLVNQRFVGLFLMLALVVVLGTADLFGVDNRLTVLFDIPEVPFSEMNRYGHYLVRTLWFAAYWTCAGVLIAIVAYLIWVRGTGSLWDRLRYVHRAFNPAVASIAGVALAGMAAAGGYIYWNTRVLNQYVSTAQQEKTQVDFEKAYAHAENVPQPRIAEIELQVDLFPEQRGYRSRGSYTLINRTDKPIGIVYVVFAAGKVDTIEMQDAELAKKAFDARVYEFRPRSPFAAGEVRKLTFSVSDSTPGFQSPADTTPVVYNGSFVHSPYLGPWIGVNNQLYLQADLRRREHGLKPLPGLPDRKDQRALRRNFLSWDADFIRFAITVSTSADQIALAPGNLERQWTEGNRAFFRYSIDRMVNFWSVVSGRYAVMRDKWNNVELAVYHEPRHGRNVPRMLEGMKAALAYYSANFGPFPHRHLRIAEFPRYASFAQSFATLVPYSESLGFIFDLSNSASFDLVWYVVAHETAHQWWAHQIVPAGVEGAQFLSESLSEYSALMVAEHRYGTHHMRQFLKNNLDKYLRGRGQTTNERPLAQAALSQLHVHYDKGGLALYALKDAIGEDALNRVLARFLRERGSKSDPYPTSLDLLALLRAEAGPQHHQLITDLFERITFWELRVAGSEAVATADGKWRVRMNVRAGKLDVTGDGREKEAPLDQMIDVGLFTADPGAPRFSDKDVIRLEKRKIRSGAQTIEFVVERKPAFVGVDPYVKLISRNTTGNVVPVGRNPIQN